MITKDHALQDLEKIEEEASQGKINAAVVLVRVAKVIIKVLITIRTNQLLTEDERKAIKEAKRNRQETTKSK